MRDLLAVVLLVVFGPGLLAYVGFLVRRSRWHESIPLIEVAIDRAAGLEPPPRNRVDHFFTFIQLGSMTLVGLIFTGLGLFIVFKDTGISE